MTTRLSTSATPNRATQLTTASQTVEAHQALRKLDDLSRLLRPNDRFGHCHTDRFDRGGCFPGFPRPQQDAKVQAELDKLDRSSGTISGEELTAAIERGAGDLDGNAAGSEFKAFDEWARRNPERLTEEARAVMDLYRTYAAQAQGKGQTGIPQDQWKQMVGDMKTIGDFGAHRELAKLDAKGGTISGDDMRKAIRAGTADKDGQAAGAELKEFEAWAKKNEARLSPEAKEALDIYREHAKKAAADGDDGMSASEQAAMFREMRNPGDASARKALGKLDKEHGPVSGEDMLEAIRTGTQDQDGHSTTSELREFEKWAKKNESRLTPEAKQVLDTYRKYAKEAGPEGLSQQKFDCMLKDMSKFKTFHDDSMRKALEGLDSKNGKISGKDLLNAINQGAKDQDGQAAGLEFADLQKWAAGNKDRLSPEAQKLLGIYEKYATRSMAKGETGIKESDFQKMLREMRQATQPQVNRPVFLSA